MTALTHITYTYLVNVHRCRCHYIEAMSQHVQEKCGLKSYAFNELQYIFQKFFKLERSTTTTHDDGYLHTDWMIKSIVYFWNKTTWERRPDEMKMCIWSLIIYSHLDINRVTSFRRCLNVGTFPWRNYSINQLKWKE